MRGGGVTEMSSTVVERVEDGAGDKEKEKKKNKRRYNRRSKHNSPNPASGSVNEVRGESGPVNEVRGESSQSIGNGSNRKSYTLSMASSSLRGLEFEVNALSEPGPSTASIVAFNSMPTLHINEQGENLLPSDPGGSKVLWSCPDPLAGGGPSAICTEKGLIPLNEFQAQSQIFASHWAIEDVNKAIEKGDAFKAVFHVNAHNRLEAYCKIEGVPVDILISGIASQNRAVEGDVVAIKVDPLSCWTKMKGTTGLSDNSSSADEASLLIEANETASLCCKGKSKVACDYEGADAGGILRPPKVFDYEDSTNAGKALFEEANGPMGSKFDNGYHLFAGESSHFGSSTGQNEVVNGVERICSMISSHPSKRPTGRVVAILETSPRRDAIIGFLNVGQWFYCKEGCKKDAKKNKSLLPSSDREYIQLAPTDPKFPKMLVLVRSLPDFIKKRVEDGDVAIEMELVAARIDDWGEGSPVPQAHISQIFGRGSEMESQINAILYENAICVSEFPPESISCLPSNTWVVPTEELQNRKDLRNLCIFTIDPRTATDLDDALSVERTPDGTVRVGVHIADVSYFVLPGTPLDIEAQMRSTSVYMLQRKIPMLPPLLSENVGSLNPGLDRLAFSILWELDNAGDVLDRWIGRTVIRSCCKLSYENVQEIVDGVIGEETCSTFAYDLPELHGRFEWQDVVGSVKSLHQIAKTLREKRFNGGALQLENSKISFLLDEYGIPYDIRLSESKDSNFLVEEFMLLANRTAAEVISSAFPENALLRRHPEPNMRKLKEFESFCCKHGLKLDTSSSGHFHRSLEHIRDKLKDDSVLFDIVISYAMRPMQLASYFCSGDLKDNKDDWSHYALAIPLYTHFTSPLRRYPDIVVHRTLAAAIDAEEFYMKQRRLSNKLRRGDEVRRCFTGVYFDKDAAESLEGREALLAAAVKHGVPCTELLADVVAHCNERKLASRYVKDACDKLYMWVLLKKKEVLLSEARVLGLGPRFMSIYIQKLAIERRIYYEDVEGLTVEYLEATSTLVMNLCSYKRSSWRAGSRYYKAALDEVALVINPCDWKVDPSGEGGSVNDHSAAHTGNAAGEQARHLDQMSESEIEPLVFPLTLRLLSTIPVALHAVGGDDGPLDIGVRLFTGSYFGSK